MKAKVNGDGILVITTETFEQIDALWEWIKNNPNILKCKFTTTFDAISAHKQKEIE